MRNFLLNVVLLLAAIFAVHACGQSNKEKYSDREAVNGAANALDAENVSTAAETDDEGLIVHLTSEQFREQIYDYRANETWQYKGTQPAIVDFYADWCRPCKMMEPTLKKVAQEYKGKLKVYKVDTDDEKDVAGKLQIMSLPSVLFIPANGEQPQMTQGALPRASFDQMINEYLLAN